MLREIFGPKKDGVRRQWRILHDEELRNLYSTPNNIRVIQIKKNEIDGVSGTYGGDKMYRVRACAQTRGHVHARTCM